MRVVGPRGGSFQASQDSGSMLASREPREMGTHSRTHALINFFTQQSPNPGHMLAQGRSRKQDRHGPALTGSLASQRPQTLNRTQHRERVMPGSEERWRNLCTRGRSGGAALGGAGTASLRRWQVGRGAAGREGHCTKALQWVRASLLEETVCSPGSQGALHLALGNSQWVPG